MNENTLKKIFETTSMQVLQPSLANGTVFASALKNLNTLSHHATIAEARKKGITIVDETPTGDTAQCDIPPYL